LIKRIAQLDELKLQAAELKRKGFRPGFDNMTAASAIVWMEVGGQKLCEDLIKGRYTPMPAIGWRIAKKGGQYRQISRLTAIDSIIQMQLLSVLTPVCEEKFSQSSFAYRAGRGTTAAQEIYCQYGTRYRYAERIDPKHCYDSIQHNILETALEEFIEDKSVCSLIMRFARMPLYSDGEITQRSMGLLQGSPISPLMCNIYLHSLDVLLENKNTSFIRYADDIVLFADTLQQLQEASNAVKEQFSRMGLTINEHKHSIDSPANLEFLGTRFLYDAKGILTIREDSEPKNVWQTWHSEKPTGLQKTVDVFSDGILRQKDFSLAFESDEARNNIPIEAVENINVYSDVIFDTGFLKKAAEHGITINLFDKQDRLIGHFLPTEALKAPRMTYEQLASYYDVARRLELSRAIVLAELHNLVI